MSEKVQEAEESQEFKIQRPKRAKLTVEELLKRMEAFERKEQIVPLSAKGRRRISR